MGKVRYKIEDHMSQVASTERTGVGEFPRGSWWTNVGKKYK
jgi:hypothetical protein